MSLRLWGSDTQTDAAGAADDHNAAQNAVGSAAERGD
jgi:hypothetical protein